MPPADLVPDLDVDAVDRRELPRLLGRIVELEAKIRLRLAEAPISPSTTATVIDEETAAARAGTSRRTLAAKTAGMAFRADLSRKNHRYSEPAFTRWLAGRK